MSRNLACWIFLYLGANKGWKEEATAEVQHLIATYTNATSEPTHQRLSTIPMSAWEDEMPVIESIIRETLRIVNNGTALRRNIAVNLLVADKTVGRGAFVACNIGDLHLNEMFYLEPLMFDPDRFNVAQADDTYGNAPFLGWGTGRHPCSESPSRILYNVGSGMKVAKLEIKMILAFVLSSYEYKLVDASGKLPKRLP
jgi:sterol 14-demethylase